MLKKYSRNTLQQFIVGKGNWKGFQFIAIYYKNTNNELLHVTEWDGRCDNLIMDSKVFFGLLFYRFEVKVSKKTSDVKP